MEDDPSLPKTVRFDVGGKLFKTARSLIDRHEGTMLARLVSDTWQEDPTKPVFIDRNGDIFEQVLEYLRYGSIALPSKLPKSMFLRDLDFYGIVPAEGTVTTESEGLAAQVEDLSKQIDTLLNEITMDFLANHCAAQYGITKGTMRISFEREGDTNTESGKLWNAFLAAKKHQDLFNNE